MKKWYRNFSIIISIIIGIILSISILTPYNIPYPTEEDYRTLKNYSETIISGTSVKEIEEEGKIEVSEYTMDKDTFKMKLEAYNCSLTATYSLIDEKIRIEGRNIIEIQYDDVSYLEETKAMKRNEKIVGIPFIALLISFTAFCVIYIFPWGLKKINELTTF